MKKQTLNSESEKNVFLKTQRKITWKAQVGCLAYWIEAYAYKPDNLRWSPGAHAQEGENQFLATCYNPRMCTCVPSTHIDNEI